jgi:hypothetical protein
VPRLPRDDWPEWIKAGLASGQLSNGAALILAEQAVSQARAARPSRASRPASGDAYASLFPPHLPLGPELAEAPRPGRPSRAAAPLADDELHRALFGDSTIDSTHSAQAAATPGHVEYDGGHTHIHSNYAGGQHSHAHIHRGDASHAPSDLHPHPAG